ncbi:MAG: hypothetical protein WA673_06820 [Candidatus Acidiferrales bacterium]
MHFDATEFLILGSLVAFAIWVWRFSSILRKTPREMRAAALRGSAKAMGSEFWERGSPCQSELAEELSAGPDSIVHTLQWPNQGAQIFSFQEIRRGVKGRTSYLYWAGYRFSERSFPKFDLKATRTASFMRPGYWRKVSLPGQIDFESRYALTGENRGLVEQFFTPARCAAILAREWPRGISLKAGGHWVLVHGEKFLHATSESDSEASVAKEIQEVSSLVTGMLPIAEALTDAHLAAADQRFVRLSEDSAKTKASWWDRLAFLFLAVVIAAVIFVSVAYAGSLWARFDLTVLRTDLRRYFFAVLFVVVLWGIGEWLVRFYRRMKQRAATRLEAQFSGLLDRS